MTGALWIALGVGAVMGWFLRGKLRLGFLSSSPLQGEAAPMVNAFEHLNEGVLVVDEDSRVRAMNTAARRLLSRVSSCSSASRCHVSSARATAPSRLSADSRTGPLPGGIITNKTGLVNCSRTVAKRQ